MADPKLNELAGEKVKGPSNPKPEKGKDPSDLKPGKGKDPLDQKAGKGKDPSDPKPGKGKSPSDPKPGKSKDPADLKPGKGKDPSGPESGKSKSSSDPKPGKSKKLMVMGGLILLIFIGAGSVFFFAPGRIPGKTTKEVGKEPKPSLKEIQGYIYSMEAFLVNLANEDTSRYLKVRIDLESSEPKINDEYEKRLPQLRDAILTILSNKTHKDVFDSEGKTKVKDEIILKINPLLNHFKIKKVFFTEFVVQ